MKQVYLLLLLLCVAQCKTPCIGDKLFQKEYQNALEFVEACFLGDISKYGDFVDAEELRSKIAYLEVITEIKAKGLDFEHLYFYNKSDAKKHIRSWEKWFKKNGCNLTKSETDSLLQKEKTRISDEIEKRLHSD